jgi:hypothetical protein
MATAAWYHAVAQTGLDPAELSAAVRSATLRSADLRN